MRPDEVNSAVEFDTPFRVTGDGNIVREFDYDAPTSTDEELDSADWEYWSDGFTGQFGYSGPVMHPSEYLGGRMAKELLADPGIYAVVPDEHSHGEPCWCGESADTAPDPEPNGWVVVKYVGPHIGHAARFTGAWFCDTCNSPYCEEA